MAIVLFLLGSLAGAVSVLLLPFIRELVVGLLRTRMILPVEAVSRRGGIALFLLVFSNNSIPVVLSFVYSFLIVKLNWTPPLTVQKRVRLLEFFTFLCAFLLGFFGFGSALSLGWLLGGEELVFNLLREASVHGPLEIAAVLLCVSEPMRLSLGEKRRSADPATSLRGDFGLLVICLMVLAIAAILEVFARL
jgi:hypothetical protein